MRHTAGRLAHGVEREALTAGKSAHTVGSGPPTVVRRAPEAGRPRPELPRDPPVRVAERPDTVVPLPGVEKETPMSSEGRSRFSLLPGALVALAVLCAASPGAAQADGDVYARVLDGQGSPLAGVQITLIKAGGQNQQKAADAEGKVHFDKLAGGVYIVTAAPEGYAQVTCPGVRVVGQSRQLEIRLMPKDGAEPSSCKVLEAAG